MELDRAQHLALIGAGPSTLYLLNSFTQMTRCPARISIFEVKSTVGVGNPYDTPMCEPNLLSNIGYDEIPPLILGFEQWYESKFYMPYQVQGQVLTRKIIGEFFADAFDYILGVLRQHGVLVYMYRNTAVTGIIEDTRDDDVRMTLVGKGKPYQGFTHIVVNVGSSFCERRPSNGYVKPYPIKAYVKPEYQRFVIMGMSLSAIDTAVGIAQYRGHFARCAKGLTYSCEAPVQMTMMSRTGHFPWVWYPSKNTTLFYNWLTSHSIKGLRDLDEFNTFLFLPLLARYFPDIFHQVNAFNFEEVLTFLAGRRGQCDAFAKLTLKLLANTHNNVDSHWPAAVVAAINVIQSTPALAQDYAKKKGTLHALLAACTAAVPRESIERILALHEAGVLTVTTECEKQASSAQKSDHHCLIDARGAEPAEKGVVRLAQLLKRTYNGLVVDTSAESLSVSLHHKLYINEKETNIYIGSAFLTPWFLNIPGLDTCAKFSRNIAKKISQTVEQENEPNVAV